MAENECGKMIEGQKFMSICCEGFEWEVIMIILDVWGICRNPDCPVGKDTYYHGVSHCDEDKLVEQTGEKIE